MNTQEIINSIISDEKNCKYFVHRTVIEPVWIDTSNGKLYTDNEYLSLEETLGTDYVLKNLIAMDDIEDEFWKEHRLDIGSGWSITEQEYKVVYNRNFEEEISNFFEKGLYAVETSIERTATPLEDGPNHELLSTDEQKKKLYSLLRKEGFGMNTKKGNGLLGTYANREELNTLLILEIPKTCFGDLDEISPLFQKSEDVFEVRTAYRGSQKIDTVIPTEYIKGAFYVKTDDVLFIDNENYRGNNILETGIYNNQTIQKILDDLKDSQDIQGTKIEKILGIIRNDFDTDNDIYKLKRRISFIKENLLSKVEDKETIHNLQLMLEELLEEIKNPLEKGYSEMLKLNFSEMNANEIMEQINNFILYGSSVLSNKKRDGKEFNRMLDIYENGLQILSEDALQQLSSDIRANYATALVRGKLKDINKLKTMRQEIQVFNDDIFAGEFQESDREKYEELERSIEITIAKICEDTREKEPQYSLFSENEVRQAIINVDITKKDSAQNRTKMDKMINIRQDAKNQPR